jgi:hypothetical protein
VQKPAAAAAPQTQDVPPPKGDIEDALQRIYDCPPDELSHLKDDLRGCRWTQDDAAKIKAAFGSRNPAPQQPESDTNGAA